MLIPCLSLLSATLAGGLIYGAVRYRRLQKQLIDRTERLLDAIDSWRDWQRRVHRVTGLDSVDDVIYAYRNLCGSIGYRLHNWTTEHNLTPERSIQLGALGNLLREVSSSHRFDLDQEQPPQVKGWLADRPHGSGRVALEWAGPDFGPLLDGLTLQQLMRLTVLLLDKSTSLEQAFMNMGICLLTPNRFWAENTFRGYQEAASKAVAKRAEEVRLSAWHKRVRSEDAEREAGWRALVQPYRDAQDAIKKRQQEVFKQAMAQHAAARTRSILPD